ncbi:hypothetical protein O9K51_04549 [Purpureocillium lavendulum]|uniref:SP-RING-type domain-containing protein n=1 Tax=Purpureocillium lavendulum TaxID=1247861 RepID=A0AB34FZB9_9HYPO|nr:hypothetical protein O9K51_04549 [Purpureocillium lavendulum]
MLQFTLTPAQIALAVSVPTGRQPVFFANGSTRYRLRACSYKRGTTVVGDSTWAISPTCWPQHIFLEFNGSPLYPRRKHHAHLDQPIELTNMLELGDNQVRVSLPSTVQKGAEEPSTYFLAIEVISTSDCETLHREVAEREHFALSDTKRELKRRLNCGSSDDVIVVEESTLRVTITDPFTSSLFTIPVRGIDCKHLECFDLGVWLETRNGKPSKFPGEPSLVDGWKCPICGHDARPVNLRVDDYFADVRANLIESGIDASDARSILVDANGDWILMQESEDNGNGTRLGPYGLSTPSSDRKTPRSFSAQTSIILDDD